MIGTLTTPNNRYGLIKPDDPNVALVFAHKSAFFGRFEKLTEPRRVSFELSEYRGKRVATSVRFL